MCGIAGIINTKGVNLEELNAMAFAQRHRGPDSYGFLFYTPAESPQIVYNSRPFLENKQSKPVVAFTHQRLGIIDLSINGQQPMCDKTNRLFIVFNGEIYNYIELRKELASEGWRFLSSGDAEVLLAAYSIWGIDCVKRFVGMWAFAILDLSTQKIILCKDRFGIKPLFYAFNNGALYFASEIKAILATGAIHPEPCQNIIAHYLIQGKLDNHKETFFKGIYRFPSASIMEMPINEPDKNKTNHYWQFYENTFQGSMHDATEYVRSLFLDAIRIHTRSDVPVGALLSGGIDSTSIVCAAKHLSQHNLINKYLTEAFGYVPFDIDRSERHYMEYAASEANLNLNIVSISYDTYEKYLDRIIKAQDQPFGSASIAAQWFVFQKAKEIGIKVILDGQGADEILAGYHGYFGVSAAHLLATRQFLQFIVLSALHRLYYGVPVMRFSTILSYLWPQEKNNFFKIKKNNQKQADHIQLYYNTINSNWISCYLPENSNNRDWPPLSLNEWMKRDVQYLGLPQLLRYEDHNAMNNSIESRVPFLDHRLVEFLFTLPEEWKLSKGMTKYIFRTALKHIIPERILKRRDKVGFKPDQSFTYSIIEKNKSELQHNQTSLEKEIFCENTIKNLFDYPNKSDYTFEFMLWRIINLKLWSRNYL